MYFILGKIFYYVARFDPIEIAAFESEQHASMGQIISLLGALMTYQGRINSGDIELATQTYKPYNFTQAREIFEQHHSLSMFGGEDLYLDEFYPDSKGGARSEKLHPRVRQGFGVDIEKLEEEEAGDEVEVDGSELRSDIESVVGTAPWVDQAFMYT